MAAASSCATVEAPVPPGPVLGTQAEAEVVDSADGCGVSCQHRVQFMGAGRFLHVGGGAQGDQPAGVVGPTYDDDGTTGC